MLFSPHRRNNSIKLAFFALAVLIACFPLATEAHSKVVVEKSSNLGIIKGVVRDEQGSPIADAVVAVFRVGTSKLLKQVRTLADGSFIARIIPGKYTVLAVAQGFNPVTVSQVQVNRSTELNYGFKLERSGSGNTLPEKRADRNSSKWRIRAAQTARSIYQAKEGESPVDEKKTEDTVADSNVEESIGIAQDDKPSAKRRSQTVAETYFASSNSGNFTGFNFATLQPLGDKIEIIFAGQTGTKSFAPQRFESTLQFRPNDRHQIRTSASVANIGKVKIGESENDLGQFSLQAIDEWKVRDGVILVLGLDFSRFMGAGSDSSLTPRLGFQLDVDPRTRVKAAYTTQTEERTWSDVIDMEGAPVLFREYFAPQSVAVEDAKPLMNKSRRLEFAIERVLDNSSSIEAKAFFDSISSRGVGLVNMPLSFLSMEGPAEFIANQHGKTQGVSLVYSRRISSTFSASAGYSLGKGQQLSTQAITSPVDIFESAFFQSFVGQLNTDLKTGTRIKTVFRLSPQATVFAIDPFAGKLAIYDPSLSILVTQSLPTLGLPIRAQAVLDARNLLDFQTVVTGQEGSLRMNSHQRILRGGIQVRF